MGQLPFDRAAVKMHTLLDLRGAIPSFIHISDGKLHDVNVLDILIPEPCAFYVMDRGYIDFARLYALHQAGAFFVTRAKSNFDARRVHFAQADRSTGVICDQTVTLAGFYASKEYAEHLRRIRFKAPDADKTLVFLTNNTVLPALTICALYKNRWHVELFFKMGQTESQNQALLRYIRECRQNSDLDRSVGRWPVVLSHSRMLPSWVIVASCKCSPTIPSAEPRLACAATASIPPCDYR
jgi:Transposase DDE domain